MAQFTWYPKQKANQAENSTKPPSEHVPLCSVTDVQLRFLCPDDLGEVRTLCQDWFPIDYPLSWYEDITSSSRFFALAAVYNLAIIGLIVAEIRPYSKLNKEDKGILPDSMGKNSDVGYILSLGVHRKHRRNGIGSLLLESLVNHLTTAERHSVKAIFLHVLTTNQPAIQFYEKRRFHLHSFLPYYYNIRGKGKDGFTYVTYINGGHPPWTLLSFKALGFENCSSRRYMHMDKDTCSASFSVAVSSDCLSIQFCPLNNKYSVMKRGRSLSTHITSL